MTSLYCQGKTVQWQLYNVTSVYHSLPKVLFFKKINKQYRKFSYPSNGRCCQFVHHFVATKLFHKSRWTLIFYRLQIILVAQHWNYFCLSFVVIISQLNINCHCFSNNKWVYYYFEGNLYSLDQNLTMSREWKRE